MSRADIPAYGVARLHGRDERSWAVVLNRTGAIVVNERGELLMRLTKADAQQLADQLSRTLDQDELPRCEMSES